MILLTKPTDGEVARALVELEEAPYSYADVGASASSTTPAGYTKDCSSVRLGEGEEVFHRARTAIRRWAPFELSWVRLYSREAPYEGIVACVVARVYGFWWLNFSRVVYTVDEPTRFGFAYGTLSVHAERGEELFLIDYSRATGEVTFRIEALSRPRHPLTWLGYPLARATQKRFARDSLAAMVKAVSG